MKKLLKDKYGNAHLKGFQYLVYILENYKFPINDLSDVLGNIAKEYQVVPHVVEKAIYHYKNKVGFEKITSSEFIANLLIDFEEKSVLNELIDFAYELKDNGWREPALALLDKIVDLKMRNKEYDDE